MPMHVHADLCHLDQSRFARIAYEVMNEAFAVHNDMGRFFDERVYRETLANRLAQSQREVLIDVRFEDFRREYFIDLLVEGGAVFELKAVKILSATHRAQLLNYLLLAGLSHGKLINFRRELVEHEFVNTHLRLADRTAFRIVDRNWKEPGPADRRLRPWLVALLRDLGAGLDLQLYESAVAHVFGGDLAVLNEVEIVTSGKQVGRQKVRLAAPGWAFKVTAIDASGLDRFEDHVRRFIAHTALAGLHWINITRACVTFSTIEKA